MFNIFVLNIKKVMFNEVQTLYTQNYKKDDSTSLLQKHLKAMIEIFQKKSYVHHQKILLIILYFHVIENNEDPQTYDFSLYHNNLPYGIKMDGESNVIINVKSLNFPLELQKLLNYLSQNNF